MKKISSFLLMLFMLTSLTANAQYLRGDVDQDGAVDISDVTSLIDYLLNGFWPVLEEYVDLGLPSGTLWATRNVGASAPEDYGDYFAWGETEPNDYYYWSSYKWCNGSETTMTKYCNKSNYGYNGLVDNKVELDPEDDAAYVNLGPLWRMPTKEQVEELCDYCNWAWTQRNGVQGYVLTGPNGNTLFLPAAGERYKDRLMSEGIVGNYWSSMLYTLFPRDARVLHFISGYPDCSSNNRYFGCPVRAVLVSQN